LAYSYDQIIKAYTELHVGKAPDRATADSLILTTSMNQSGQLSDAQVVSILVNGADDTTAVAVMSYQFFTGKSPTAAGLTYLVNSATNTTDLNDGYYSKFNLENRYINFAANLGLYGEGATAFASKYGAMDFNTYVASIYETIIGRSYAEAASVNVDAAISYLIGTRDAVLQTVREAGLVTANSTAAQIDLAVKAAMSGLVMAAAIKADVGLYAAATDNFMVALTQGNAVYNTDITVSYRPSYDTAAHGTGHAVDRGPSTLPNPVTITPVTPPPVVTSFTLGSGANNITGSALADTFTTTSANLHSGDVLNGGGGNDVLNFTLSSGLYVLPAVTVSSIETVNASVTGNFRAYNWSGWTGMTSLNLTGIGVAVMDIQSIPTTANVTLGGAVYGSNNTMISGGHNTNVTVTSGAGNGSLEVDYNTGDTHITRTNTGSGTHGNISVNGTGGNAYITQVADLTGIALGSSQANGTVGFGGSATSTSVEIVNPTPVAATVGTVGITGAGVNIIDYNSTNNSLLGTLTTIKVDGFTAPGYAFIIQDNALTNLSIAHGTGRVYLDNSTAVAGSPTTLNLAVNAVNVEFWEQGVYTTLNVTTGATASTISDLQMAALTTLNVSGSSNLNLSSLSNASSLHTATVTGAASLTATFGAGADTINLGAGASVIDTGGGLDVVNITAANAASNTVFSTLTLSPGDKLGVAALGGAAALTGAVGAIATGTTLQQYLNDAASGDGHATSIWRWFQFNGDTYIVVDNSADNGFHAGTDIVVKLVGIYNEGGATVTAGVMTMQ